MRDRRAGGASERLRPSVRGTLSSGACQQGPLHSSQPPSPLRITQPPTALHGFGWCLLGGRYPRPYPIWLEEVAEQVKPCHLLYLLHARKDCQFPHLSLLLLVLRCSRSQYLWHLLAPFSYVCSSFPIRSSFNEHSSSASLSTREFYAIHGNPSVFAQVRRIQA